MSQHISAGLQTGNNGTDRNTQLLSGNLQSVTVPMNSGVNSQAPAALQSDVVLEKKDHQQSEKTDQQQIKQEQQRTLSHQIAQQDQQEHQQQQQLKDSTQPQVSSQSITSSIHHSSHHAKNQLSSSNDSLQFLTKTRLQELVKEVDPTEQLDDEVEEMLLQLADDFVETTVNAACLLAKHRHANTVEVKDVQLHLERNWNMWIPGFGTDEVRPYKRATVTEAHKQRLALIRKSVKKY